MMNLKCTFHFTLSISLGVVYHLLIDTATDVHKLIIFYYQHFYKVILIRVFPTLRCSQTYLLHYASMISNIYTQTWSYIITLWNFILSTLKWELTTELQEKCLVKVPVNKIPIIDNQCNFLRLITKCHL